MTSRTVVVDASALVAAVADTGPFGTKARGRLRDCRRIAPFLVDAEVGSALRSMVLRRELNQNAAEPARLLAERLIHRRYPHHGALAARAWELRHSLSFYDALYLALAEKLNCPLITADQRLARAIPTHPLINPLNPSN